MRNEKRGHKDARINDFNAALPVYVGHAMRPRPGNLTLNLLRNRGKHLEHISRGYPLRPGPLAFSLSRSVFVFFLHLALYVGLARQRRKSKSRRNRVI